MLRTLFDFRVYGSSEDEINRRMVQVISDYYSLKPEETTMEYISKNFDIELRIEQTQKDDKTVDGFTGHVVAKLKSYS